MLRISLIGLFLCVQSVVVLAGEPCRIEVVDAENGWPVPLIELRTTHQVTFVTDNAGLVAFDLPELMGRETFFFVQGHGYSVPPDGFGYRGLRLTPQAGETIQLKVNRQLPAKRLGRLTGAGLFAESQKLGEHLDWKEQGIVGCDSVQLAVHNQKLFWVWGDTTLAKYPLGIFNSLGATTALRPLDQFKPPVKLPFSYFKNESEEPRGICHISGKGPTWLSGVVSLKDKNGDQRLGSTYVKIKPPLRVYQTGLCVWDENLKMFEPHVELWTHSENQTKSPPMPEGHPVLWKDDAGIEWVLFGDPFPHLKCRATFEAWSDPSAWEELTPQKTVSARDSNRLVQPHRGSMAWNAYRQKWVSVFTEQGGKESHLGEIWYAEANTPLGPWEAAVKVVTHKNYTFYNPRLHPELTSPDQPILVFEGTYTKQFSKTKDATPRYDYNQILYRLDLDDSRLIAP